MANMVLNQRNLFVGSTVLACAATKLARSHNSIITPHNFKSCGAQAQTLTCEAGVNPWGYYFLRKCSTFLRNCMQGVRYNRLGPLFYVTVCKEYFTTFWDLILKKLTGVKCYTVFKTLLQTNATSNISTRPGDPNNPTKTRNCMQRTLGI